MVTLRSAFASSAGLRLRRQLTRLCDDLDEHPISSPYRRVVLRENSGSIVTAHSASIDPLWAIIRWKRSALDDKVHEISSQMEVGYLRYISPSKLLVNTNDQFHLHRNMHNINNLPKFFHSGVSYTQYGC